MCCYSLHSLPPAPNDLKSLFSDDQGRERGRGEGGWERGEKREGEAEGEWKRGREGEGETERQFICKLKKGITGAFIL